MTAPGVRGSACDNHFADKADATAAAHARRAAGYPTAYARKCTRCGRWRCATRGRQGNVAPLSWQATWRRVYKHRINHGLERCRWPGCGRRDVLTFDHILPWSVRPGWSFDNTTILCRPHNVEKGDQEDPTGALISLAAEEAAAPPEQRWSQIGRELYGLPPRRRQGRKGVA